MIALALAFTIALIASALLSHRVMAEHAAKRRVCKPVVYVGPVYRVRDLGTVDSVRTEVGAVR